jgi:hypothetical protein
MYRNTAENIYPVQTPELSQWPGLNFRGRAVATPALPNLGNTAIDGSDGARDSRVIDSSQSTPYPMDATLHQATPVPQDPTCGPQNLFEIQAAERYGAFNTTHATTRHDRNDPRAVGQREKPPSAQMVWDDPAALIFPCWSEDPAVVYLGD